MYIAIEGSNCSGKTTLINAILPLFSKYTFIKLPYNVDFQLAVKDTKLFEDICLEQIRGLPISNNLLTDRSYVSYAVYNVARRVYAGHLKTSDIKDELRSKLLEIQQIVRPIDLLFLLYIQPSDFERWLQLHNQRFNFLDDPIKYGHIVYTTWAVFRKLVNEIGILTAAIPAYLPLSYQRYLVIIAKELLGL